MFRNRPLRLSPLHALAACGLMAGVLLGVGCGGGTANPDDGGPPVDWEFGESAVYQAAPGGDARITDPISGSIFRVPGSRGGSLTVTAIVSGPQAAPEDSAFALSYTGSDPVQILVPHRSGDFDFVFGYAPFEGVVRSRGYERRPAGDRPMSRLAIPRPFPPVRLPPGFHFLNHQTLYVNAHREFYSIH